MSIRAVGLVGGGTMGQGIAIACGAAGLDVLLYERTPEHAKASVGGIAESLSATSPSGGGPSPRRRPSSAA